MPAAIADIASPTDTEPKWESVTDYSSDFVDEDLERNALGEFRLRVTRRTVPGGSFVKKLTRAEACQWCVERLLPSGLREKEEPPPRAEAPAPLTHEQVKQAERILKAGGWELRFDPVGEYSYFEKLGSRIQIQGSGYATPNWTIYFNALPMRTLDELFAMCAALDAAHWHSHTLEAVLAEFRAQGWRVTNEGKKPHHYQLHGRVSIELYLWGNELCFYTYTADDAGKEHTLSLLDGTSPKDMAEIIMDSE